MKANAPEKLYVDVQDNLSDSILYGFTEKSTDEDIEYTRTDAFIEKACEFFEDHLCCYIKAQDFTIEHSRLEQDFKSYMKGE